MKGNKKTAETIEQDNEQEQMKDADQQEVVSAEQPSAVTAEVVEESQGWQSKFNDAQQKLLRLQADFDNFRKRSRIEREDAAKYASLPVIIKILPALDNLERAIAASSQNVDFEGLVKGVEMTAKQLLEGLHQEGLQSMNCVGELFNPELHQAVMQIDSDEFGEGQIVEELQKGYLLKDKVIRPAMVKVNKA
jgi:molecular chaperone GrpE